MQNKSMCTCKLQLLVFAIQLWLIFVPLSATSGNPGFISIDCGVDEDYEDEETGIFYKSDRDFISTGENGQISPEYYTQVPFFGRRSQNLRYFPKGTKNCFTLQPKQGKNHNYLVRTLFQYGNYDSKNQTPTFDFYVGVYYWRTLEFKSASEWQSFEIIDFSLTDAIYVCLVNTGGGIPFISALELRLLNDSIYRTESRTLDRWGYDIGISTNTFVRYKDDVYDRMWQYCDICYDWISINTASEIDVGGSNKSFELPVEVMRSAAQPRTPLRLLNYSFANDYKYYFCFHFAEILQIAEGQRREFTINLNGVNLGPVTPEYLKLLTMCSYVSPIEGIVGFSLNSTMRSDLPPILNALEIFAVYMLPELPTDAADVDAILAIKQTYKINKDDNWQGDPCMPRGFTWTGLSCSYENYLPRIISLDLSSSNLSGKISLSFSNLRAIQSLDLSYNELIGEVPEFLAQLPNLTSLSLTGNKLTGSVPPPLLQKSSNGMLQLRLKGNPNLCQTESCGKKKKGILVPVVASVVAVSVLLLVSVVIFCKMKNREETTESKKKRSSIISKNRCFSYEEIVDITDNFKTIIGEGGFGKVYFGTLKDKTQVAVKLLSQYSRQGYKEFQAEVRMLMIVHHRNLVSLIGYCDDRYNKALLYEYMVNGNLKDHLSEASKTILNWEERLQIATDTAYGLDYLHNCCKPPIIHRDLKTSNILLNEKLQAKIADFGLSRAFANEGGSHVTTRPAGTFGYMDPDALLSGNFSKMSDVYSFGIILLELITGQPALRKSDISGDIIQIQHWVRSLTERGDIQSIVDYRLQEQFDRNSAWKFVEIALNCVLNDSNQRLDMSYVLAELKDCLAMVMYGRYSRKGDRERSSFSLEMKSLTEIDSDMFLSPR